MSRKSDLFFACAPDQKYIFEHEEYEWDDIVNAFIAGGLYADANPQYKWIKLTEKTIESLSDYTRYLVYNEEYDEYYVLDGTDVKRDYQERSYTYAKEIDYPSLI